MKKIIAALAILVMSALIVPAWADSETPQGGSSDEQLIKSIIELKRSVDLLHM